MAASDEDIRRVAYLWMRAHGDKALERARGVLDSTRRSGDGDGVQMWLGVVGIIVALEGGVPADLH